MSRNSWIFVSLAVLVIGGGVGYLFYRRANGPEALLAAEVAAVTKDGIPMTPDGLRPKTPVPDDQNAATVYESAFPVIQSVWKAHPNLVAEKDNLMKGAASSADLEDVREAVSEAKDAIHSIVAAGKRPACDFHFAYESADFRFPELVNERNAARLIALDAHLLADKGRVGEAFELLAGAAAMGRHLGETPMLITALVQVSIDMVVFDEFCHLLQCSAHSQALLQKAQRTLDSFGEFASLRSAIQAEVVMGLGTIKRFRTVGDVRASDYTHRDQKGQGERLTDAQIAELKAELLSTYRSALESLPIDGKGWKAQYEAMSAYEAQMTARAKGDTSADHELKALMGPSNLAEAALALGRQVANRHIAATAIRLMMDRLKTGKYPATLPDYGEFTLDPYDGKPLRYKPKGSGFVIYSIFRDFVDNGGQGLVGGKGDLVQVFK